MVTMESEYKVFIFINYPHFIVTVHFSSIIRGEALLKLLCIVIEIALHKHT